MVSIAREQNQRSTSQIKTNVDSLPSPYSVPSGYYPDNNPYKQMYNRPSLISFKFLPFAPDPDQNPETSILLLEKGLRRIAEVIPTDVGQIEFP